MSRLTVALGRALRHTRLVPAGSPPLYRLMLAATVVSSITQALDRSATVSVTSITPPSMDWFDWSFIGLQGFGGLMALAGLYSIDGNKYHAGKLNSSLTLEASGLIFVMTCVIVNVVAVAIYYGQLPTRQGTWFQIIFLIWSCFRLRDIRKAIGELTR